MLNELLSKLRSNTRLRWGLWCIFAILWLYAILVARDELQNYQTRYLAISQPISRLNAQLMQTEWISRVEPIKTLTIKLEGKLWQAPSSGLAQAAFVDWLKATLAQSGITQSKLDVAVVDKSDTSTQPENELKTSTLPPSDLWAVRAKISFEFKPESFTPLLERIEFGDKIIRIDKLTIRKEPIPSVDIQLTSYFQKQTSPEKSGTERGKVNRELVPL